MGCDIHLYVEYNKKKAEKDYWWSFGSRFNLGRNYLIFGLLSEGVRCDVEGSIKPKGLPENLSFTTNNDNSLYISENSHEERSCSLEQAKRWEKNGYKITYNENNVPVFIEHPDWHSHTWLTLEEYKQALTKYDELADYEIAVDYKLILSVLEKLEAEGYDARLVIWFDN